MHLTIGKYDIAMIDNTLKLRFWREIMNGCRGALLADQMECGVG